MQKPFDCVMSCSAGGRNLEKIKAKTHAATMFSGGLIDMATATVTELIPRPQLFTAMSEGELIGSRTGLRHVWNSVQLVARTDSGVLIHGETGTGKELIAKAIHEGSNRRSGPFVKVNCAAMPGGLLESELFGHERGAFTGAWTQTTGRFQLADGGTLFLDEIGDLPLELQPKLLRVLQEQEFERLGGARTIRVDVRVVAATNQDLAQMVQDRRFRADLYYRLNVFPILLPPLRDRSEDIPLLAQHFASKFARRLNKELKHIPIEVMEVLRLHDWPGNIRELQNVIERAMILSPGPEFRLPPDELKHLVKRDTPAGIRTLAHAERDHILHVLRQVSGVVGGRDGAAARLGVPRTTLLYRMRKLGIAQGQAGVASASAATA
jgi:formate hydrogenlyase transcriptional activator